MMEYCRIH